MNDLEEQKSSEVMGRLNMALTFIMILLVIAYSAVLFLNQNEEESSEPADLSVSEISNQFVDCTNLDINNSGDIDLAELEFIKNNLGKTCN